jgi:hypothetical protein
MKHAAITLTVVCMTSFGCGETVDTSKPSATFIRLSKEYPVDATSVHIKQCKINGIEHQPPEKTVTVKRESKIEVSGVLSAGELGISGIPSSYKERIGEKQASVTTTRSVKDPNLTFFLTVHGKPDAKGADGVVFQPVETRQIDNTVEFHVNFEAPKQQGLFVVDLRLLYADDGTDLGDHQPKRPIMPVWRFPLVVE